MTVLNDIIERIKEPVESCTEVSEELMWSRQGTPIWQAQHLIGSPKFYPIYRYQDYYSYSLLALILLKGRFHLKRAAMRKIPGSGLKFLGRERQAIKS